MGFQISRLSPNEKKWFQSLEIDTTKDQKPEDISVEDLVVQYRGGAKEKCKNSVRRFFGRMSEIKPSKTAAFEKELENAAEPEAKEILKDIQDGKNKRKVVEGEEFAEMFGVVVEITGDYESILKYQFSFNRPSGENEFSCGCGADIVRVDVAKGVPVGEEENVTLARTNNAGNTVTFDKMDERERVVVEGSSNTMLPFITVYCYSRDNTVDIVRFFGKFKPNNES